YKNNSEANFRILEDFSKRLTAQVASTFTDHPYAGFLSDLGDDLDLGIEVNLIGYNQILQELTNTNGAFHGNLHGLNIILFRFCDWHRYRREKDSHGFISAVDCYHESISDFYASCMNDYKTAFQFYTEHCPAKTLVIYCPESMEYQKDENWCQLFHKKREEFAAFAKQLRGIYFIDASAYHKDYEIKEIFDPTGEVLGHIPYLPSYFNYLAAITTRHYYSLIRKKPKVIIVDCDNTLWKGIVGEAGTFGIEITKPFRLWQKKLKKLAEAGWLICLCSKNNEADVLKVFEQNPGMCLTMDDIVSYQINWEIKSENIRKLAAGLNLNPDSFVFIDDSFLECEEVHTAYPQVTTLCFPKEEEKIMHFIQHTWILDNFDTVTAEDITRTESYKANAKRENLKKKSQTYEKFLLSLNIQVGFFIISDVEIDRASQLTKRTNQFNLTSIRRDEQQMKDLCLNPEYTCVGVNVEDKFGTYGQVGLIIGKKSGHVYEIDTFLLSCRALGRGVEFQMIMHTAQLAKGQNCTEIIVYCYKNEKNQPAFDFFNQLSAAVPHARQEKVSAEKYLCKYTVDNLLKTEWKETEEKAGIVREDIEAYMRETISKCTNIPGEQISFTQSIEDFAWESMKKIEISSEILKKYPMLPITFLYEYPTLKDILNELELGRVKIDDEIKVKNQSGIDGAEADDIAIIGMEAYLPGAENIYEFWENLAGGICSISEVPTNRWDSSKHYDITSTEAGKTFCNHGGFLTDIESFDHHLFGISATEAIAMDPQQRLFLQIVLSAVENAGYRADNFESNTGVFVGAIANDFGAYLNTAAEYGYSPYRWGDFYQIANRVSYFFNWQGPSMVIDSACSSSGSAIYLACKSIADHDCNVAVVGGVNLILHPSRYIQYSQMGLLSDQNICCPFGADAKGTIMGEGIGAIILKRKSQAIKDGDYIYGVIKGCSVNNGGKTNGFTVPNPKAQTELIQKAIRKAGISPEKISYIEAHGTGTLVGDPIEVKGISRALGPKATATYVGSVKSNIGHLESAAAIAGFMKVLLQMKYRKLVPSLHANPLNPLLDLTESKLILPGNLEDWHTENETFYAGISSFGAGGSNFHAIIKSYEEEPQKKVYGESFLILLSARTKEQLLLMVKQLDTYLRIEQKYQVINDEKEYLARLAYTLQIGRNVYQYRFAKIIKSLQELFSELKKMIESDGGFEQIWDMNCENKLYPFDQQLMQYFQQSFPNCNLEMLANSWLMGMDIPWRHLYENYKLRKLPLPGIVFEKKIFALSMVKEYGAKDIFYKKIDSPGLTAKCYEVEIGLKKFPFLLDHQVKNTLIVPGAFSLSFLLTTIMRELKYPML
ncbi:MAG: HAD-IIIC family phosphatase, partial [Lachnospiraceae bacterium]|nr:HAD-IIIC family phosphatase [Lachnospiraceae bacterium]